MNESSDALVKFELFRPFRPDLLAMIGSKDKNFMLNGP